MNVDNMDISYSTSENTPVKVVQMQPVSIENKTAGESVAVNDWTNVHQVPTEVIKQEPMDIEHRSHSPNNDSGISPGHGSSESTSAGQPSPTQNGSPEQYNDSQRNKLESNIEKIQEMSYYSQHVFHNSMASIWGINSLANTCNQNIVPQTSTSENPGPSGAIRNANIANFEYHTHYQSISPKSNLQIYQNSTPKISPSHNTTCPPIHTNRNSPGRHQNNKTPPKSASPPSDSTVPNINAPPEFNPGISDDNNSHSSSCSSPDYMNYKNEYLKITKGMEQNPLHCLQMTVEQTTMITDERGELMSSEQGPNGLRNTFQCAFCSFNTTSRIEFNDHNKIHCPDMKCNHCDFVTKVVEELEIHLREVHMVSPSAEGIGLDENDDAGIKVPRVNSQGKIKTLRCKQCNFVGVTKESFWNHCRTHIKPDKLLTCPRCPFVTEYKHHLEYHLRNHAKSKPYKCNKCDYSCVNKSMLNSHLKSHSQIYQYRCSDCSYATKYCHSLKLHLRKYNHEPALVLNPDGTPNPNPVIDVYGTRRGPKRPRNTLKVTNNKSKPALTNPYPYLPTPYALVAPPSGEVAMSYPYGPVIPNAFPINNNSTVVPAFPQNINPYTDKKNDSTIPINGDMSSDNFSAFSGLYYQMTNNNNYNNNNNIVIGNNLMKEKHCQTQDFNDLDVTKDDDDDDDDKNEESDKAASGKPLDLSKPETVNVEEQKIVALTNTTPVTPCSSQKTTKNRRKGPAFKIEHISLKLQQNISSQESDSPVLTESFSEKSKSPVSHLCVVDSNVSDNESSVPLSQNRNISENMSKIDTGKKNDSEINALERKDYSCCLCGITFSDAILYTIHKGYHGFQDPFQCNACGVKTGNKIEFNLHIARESHS